MFPEVKPSFLIPPNSKYNNTRMSAYDLGAVYVIPDRVRSGMKNKIWYCVYIKVFPNELVLEWSFTKQRARRRTAENQRKKRLSVRWPGREPVSFRNELWSPFTWFRERISHWNESFDPEREPGVSSIWNVFSFVPGSCKHYSLKCSVTRGGMKKPERAHSGLKLDPLSCKQPLQIPVIYIYNRSQIVNVNSITNVCRVKAVQFLLQFLFETV